MNKVEMWKERMNTYYNDISNSELKMNLEESGFKTDNTQKKIKKKKIANNKTVITKSPRSILRERNITDFLSGVEKQKQIRVKSNNIRKVQLEIYKEIAATNEVEKVNENILPIKNKVFVEEKNEPMGLYIKKL